MKNESSYTVYADESGKGEQYLSYGAILLPMAQAESMETELDRFCSRHGFRGQELSWKKCSKGQVDRYQRFAGLFWDLQASLGPIDFRAMVVDTSRYRLKASEFGCPTAEDGFYKFYHFFLTRSLEIVAPKTMACQLVVADTSDRYRYRTEILTHTSGGGLRKALDPRFEVEVIRRRPKISRIHQLADVLLGAVSRTLNAPEADTHKQELRGYIQTSVGRRLDWDFMPRVRPFNIWSFTGTGRTRWAPGSSGRA